MQKHSSRPSLPLPRAGRAMPAAPGARHAVAVVAALALTGGLLALAASPATAADSAYDLNKDGYRDAVVSAPNATVGGHKSAGAVVVQYGSASGLQAGKRSVLTQSSAGVPGSAEAGDRFGAYVSVADYDSDGHLDLFVGAPGEEVNADVGGGSLTVLWGTPTGPGKGVTIPDPAPRDHDAYGKSFAVADFTGDGRADLALGSDDCWVHLVHGDRDRSVPASGWGVKADCSDAYGLDSMTVVPEGLYANLVVTGRGRGGADAHGSAPGTWLFAGTPLNAGLDHAGELPGGSAVATAELTGDGQADLVIGAPDAPGGGKVMVLNSAVSSPRTTPDVTLTQATAGVPGAAESGDRFGASVWLGDLDRDGHRELAVGAPGEDLGSAADAGQVVVVPGSAQGLAPAGSAAYTQSTAGVPGASESGDRFGTSVLLADLSKDGYGDLTVGASGENTGAGALTWLRGTASGPGTSGATGFSGTSAGLTGPSQYGSRLAR